MSDFSLNSRYRSLFPASVLEFPLKLQELSLTFLTPLSPPRAHNRIGCALGVRYVSSTACPALPVPVLAGTGLVSGPSGPGAPAQIFATMSGIPAKMTHFLAKMSDMFAKMTHISAKMSEIPAKTKHFLSKMTHFLAKMSEIPAKMTHFPAKMSKIPAKMTRIFQT